MRIFKFSLTETDFQTVEMPTGAKILTLQTQHEQAQIWVLCDPTAPKEIRRFVIHGTGHLIVEDPGKYIGSYQLLEGNLVFHVFEI